MRLTTRIVLLLLTLRPPNGAAAQSPRTANPERPTVATHAYAVAPGYAELEQGTRAFGVRGVGDVGAAVKLSRAVSKRGAVALVPAVTLPTGDAARGLGAGRTLGSLVAVYSVDLSAQLHFDGNAGPVGVGAGTPQWFSAAGFAWAGGGGGGAGRGGVATGLL